MCVKKSLHWHVKGPAWGNRLRTTFSWCCLATGESDSPRRKEAGSCKTGIKRMPLEGTLQANA